MGTSGALLYLVDASVYSMILASSIVALIPSLFRRTAVFMLVFSCLNLAADPLLSLQGYNNPYILALANFLGSVLVLMWGSKSTKDMFFLTGTVSGLFIVGMAVELFLLIDVNSDICLEADACLVYDGYEMMIFTLTAAQIAILYGGIHYGRIREECTDDSGASNRSNMGVV